MELKDSRTRVNLMRAFAGESQARNRYTIAASEAKKQGLQIIESVFLYTADQERAHAAEFYKRLKPLAESNIEIAGGYPVDYHDTALKMLQSAVKNETEEWDTVYKSFAQTATEEGFTDIARLFELVAAVEKVHADRFAYFAKLLQEGTLFSRTNDVEWLCANCGYVHHGTAAPKVCPVCQHGQGYFSLFEKSLFE